MTLERKITWLFGANAVINWTLSARGIVDFVREFVLRREAILEIEFRILDLFDPRAGRIVSCHRAGRDVPVVSHDRSAADIVSNRI